MNKRIEELTKKCIIISYQRIAVDYFDKEKFAELIIQSIANIDFRMEIGLTSDQDMDIRNLIKNHFADEQ